MSIRMLDIDGEKLKHTLQDDMEALFYVVLFCALTYQEHHLSPMQLKSTLKNLFDETMTFGPGIVRGGNGKTVNSLTRMFTRGVGFESAHLGEWINTVADFFHPAERANSSSDENSIDDDYQDRWSDPKHLDVYWATFLQTHKMEQNNRSVQEIPSYLDDETPSPLMFPHPPSPPLPSPHPLPDHGGQTSRKRPVPKAISSDDTRSTKRTRRSGHGAPISSGTRHSARLEEKLKRALREKEAEKRRKEKEAAKRSQDKQR